MRNTMCRAGSLVALLAGLAGSPAWAQVPGLKNQDVGFPTLAGSTAFAGGKYTIVGGGNDIWNTADNFHYAYITVTGDFDYVVQVESLQGPDTWSKAELMAREGTDDGAGGLTLDASDRHLSNMTTRSAGQNEVGLQWRSDARGSGSAWPNDIGIAAPVYRPTYPNTWLRLERVGSKFWGYASSDGVAWTLLRGSPYDFAALNGNEANPRTDGNLATKLALGMAVTAHNDGDATGGIGVFSGFARWTPVPIAITTQPPATLSVPANGQLTLTAAVTGDPVHFQWQKGGEDLPGQTATTLTIALVKPSDAGSYTLKCYGAGQTTALTSPCVVTVTSDVTPPTLADAVGASDFTHATLSFSEPVAGPSATTAANYTVSPVLAVTAAELSADGYQVRLTMARQAEATDYTVTVNNVQDTAGNPVAAGSQITFKSFSFLQGGLKMEVWYNLTGSLQDFLNDPRYPASPDFVGYVTNFTSRLVFSDQSHENYGGRLSGWIVPTETAAYEFFLRSDDASQLRISSDADPANATQIAEETGCCGPFEEPGAPETSSPISLTAGTRYYIEALWKEGGGGDYCDVAWRKAGDPAVPRALPYIQGNVLFTFATLGTFTPPTLAWTAPADGATFDTNAPVTLTVTATAAGGKAITRVEFFDGSLKVGEATTSPYSITLTGLSEDPHKFMARATDTAGISAETPPITVNVGSRSVVLLVANIDEKAGEVTTWRYDRTGRDLGTAWREKNYDDTQWPEGRALIADETTTTVEPIRTPISRFNDNGEYVRTFYFRKRFNFNYKVNGFVRLKLRHVVDDGVIVYLNGHEIQRLGIADDPVNYLSDASGHENVYEGPYELTSQYLEQGENVLAAEVHQSGGSSSDMVFGAELSIVVPLEQKQIEVVKIDDQTTWRYDRSGSDLGTEWRQDGFNDSAWAQGKALIADETTTTVEPIRTPISRFNDNGEYVRTFYFRTRFTLPIPSTAGAKLKLRHVVDDGVILYLNGGEINRLGITDDPVNYLSDATGHENVYEGPFDIPIDHLKPGDNLLAAEVHQSGGSSSDMVFGAELIASVWAQKEGEPPAELKFTKVQVAGGNVTLEWTGAGSLWSAPAVTGSWSKIDNASSPYTAPTAGASMTFYRLQQ